jgi:mannose-6-phosphate isomerase-like protein (cupin superfamily)
VEPRRSNTNWFGIAGWDGWPRVPVDPGSQFVPTSSFPPRSIADGVRVSIAEFPSAPRLYEATREAGSDRMTHYGADGMHSTLTVDVAFVISGRIVLRQRDSAELELSPGDCVVQNATEHSWRNDSDEPAVVGFVILSAEPGEAPFS